MKIDTTIILQLKEKENPRLRRILEILAREEDFDNITWKEDNNTGAIDIFVYETFGDDLTTLLAEINAEFEADDSLNSIGEFDREDVLVLAEFAELMKTVITPQNVVFS